MNQPKPKGRPKRPEMRTYQVRMTEAQHAEFKRRGGSSWLHGRLDGVQRATQFLYSVPMSGEWRK